MFSPISRTILDQIKKAADKEKEAEEEKLKASTYWALCPSCGRKVARRQILEEGCWLCGWKGSEEKLELTRAKRASGQESKPTVGESYKTRCLQCGRLVITEELKERGCYICGWRPSSPLRGGEASPELSEGTR
jgi:acetyl-CoA carboxylase beta subunit